MRVERIPTFRDNYTYLVIDPATDEAAVVDAPEADPVIERVESLDVKVAKVLSTHHHPDHSAANPVLAERYGAPVFGHVSDAKRIPGFTDGLEEGDTISVGELEAEILFIPAHTRGHIAYVFPGAVFSGPGALHDAGWRCGSWARADCSSSSGWTSKARTPEAFSSPKRIVSSTSIVSNERVRSARQRASASGRHHRRRAGAATST